MQSSINTSILLNIFEDKPTALHYHMFNSTKTIFEMSKIGLLQNFDITQLQNYVENPNIVEYPSPLNEDATLEYIWICKINGDYTLLYGSHCIIAHHIEGRTTIPAYIINLPINLPNKSTKKCKKTQNPLEIIS